MLLTQTQRASMDAGVKCHNVVRSALNITSLVTILYNKYYSPRILCTDLSPIPVSNVKRYRKHLFHRARRICVNVQICNCTTLLLSPR